MIDPGQPGQSRYHFMVTRSRTERRGAVRQTLPYVTEEGLVLLDRRGASDRRHANHQSSRAADLRAERRALSSLSTD
ncbi:hypothetical protein RCH09_003868 [Actimicrobium sp. GrIS 1.19]|uniref:hypothetical protein n=1 Tax=Actimicrobium sp. GrIS 1.19 TaxID=3071708 RepID=UPI002E0171DA|nr:hypothetical protein [Actimicrobium sp. GrIS 1.19]